MSPICPYTHSFIRQIPTRCRASSAWPLRHRRNWAKVPCLEELWAREGGQFIHQSLRDEAHATEKTTALCCRAKAVGAEVFGFIVDSRHSKVSPTTALFK